MLKLDMTTSDTLSKPYTIKINPNIFKKYINKTNNNEYTTCLDLALKKVSLNTYITNLGKYNSTGFNNKYTEEKRTPYTYTDYSQQCPDGWSNSNGTCYNWWNYSGSCNAGQYRSGYQNCRWVYVSQTCNSWNWQWVDTGRPWWRWWGDDDGYWTQNYYDYECGTSNWQCDPYTYQLDGSNFQNYSNDDKKNWASSCQADWPQATGIVITPGFYTCNINTSLINAVSPIGIIPISEDPVKYAIFYIFQYNILPDQDAYFAYYSDGTNYNIFISNTTDASIFTNQGEYDSNQTSICQGVNSSFTNYPVSVFKLSKKIYNDGNFSKCAIINNSINNINRMNSQSQDSQFSQEIKNINENYTNYEQNKYKNSTTSVQKNLNEIIKNLTDNYNQKAQIYNSTTDAIKNHDFILSSRNQKLNKQSEDLLKIQDNIILKSREIELNNETTNKQLFIKRVMQGSFVLFPLIILILILMYYQAIGPYVSLGIIGLLVVCYIIYIVVINNKMKIRQFLKPVMGSIREYDNVARQVYNDIIPPVCKSEAAEENEMIDKRQFNLSILNSNGPFYYYDGSAPPEQIYPIPIGSIQFDTGNGIVIFPEEINMSLNNLNNIMLYIFFTSWMGLMMKNGMNLNDPKFLRQLNITDLEDISSTYNLPVWENIGLPITADFEDNIKVKCSKYNDIRMKSGKNASIFLVDTWNLFLGDEIPNDIYQKWLKKINSVILRKGNITKVYNEFYEYVLDSKQFKEKYPSPNGVSNFIQAKFTDFMNFLTQNVKFAEKPSFDLSFNLQ
jgi:uncharacterized membrane protein